MMKAVIKLEELGLFILGIYFFNQLEYAWWWFLALILVPDVARVGDLIVNKFKSISINFEENVKISS